MTSKDSFRDRLGYELLILYESGVVGDYDAQPAIDDCRSRIIDLILETLPGEKPASVAKIRELYPRDTASHRRLIRIERIGYNSAIKAMRGKLGGSDE